jgi:hypothetical protein
MGGILLKWALDRWGCEGMDWIHWMRIGSSARFPEVSNEIFVSINPGIFLTS